MSRKQKVCYFYDCEMRPARARAHADHTRHALRTAAADIRVCLLAFCA